MTTAALPFPIRPDALTQRLGTIMAALRALVAARGGRDRAIVPVVLLVWARLARLTARFDRLMARLAAGRRPLARRRRVGTARVGVARDARASHRARLPRGTAWLARLMPETRAIGTQLHALLAEPGVAALLLAAPEAGRILAPLCRMLAEEMPAAITRAAAAAATPPAVGRGGVCGLRAVPGRRRERRRAAPAPRTRPPPMARARGAAPDG